MRGNDQSEAGIPERRLRLRVVRYLPVQHHEPAHDNGLRAVDGRIDPDSYDAGVTSASLQTTLHAGCDLLRERRRLSINPLVLPALLAYSVGQQTNEKIDEPPRRSWRAVMSLAWKSVKFNFASKMFWFDDVALQESSISM